MSVNKTVLFLSCCLLAACGQKESASPSQASASDSPQTVSAPAPVAVSQPAPAAASAPAALGGELQTADRAAWQKYRCAEGSVEARYYKGSAGPEAQIRYKGGILTAAYSAAGSDEDLTAFSDGTQTWTIGNEFGNDFYKEGNGFLVHHEQAEGIDGTEATVDNLLLHECTPVS